MLLDRETAGEPAHMDAHCRVELFGDVRLVREDNVVARFRTRKTAHLLACLALPPGRGHTREALSDRFWPDLEPEPGRDSLSAALSALRKGLEPGKLPTGAVLIADRFTVRLNPAAVSTDVQECDNLLDQAARTPDPLRRASLLGRAVALCQDELVSGCYDDWVLPEQSRWAERRVDGLLAWAQALEEAGDLEQALDVAARAAAADPLREDACARRIRLYTALGRHADARGCFRDYERRLQEDMGTAPPASLRGLLELASTGAATVVVTVPATPPAAGPMPGIGLPPLDAGLEPRFRPLPLPLNRFYGRHDELERLVALLNPNAEPAPANGRLAHRPATGGCDVGPPVRLLTVTGVGGAGKTRLALEAARRVAPIYGGRVAFVALESLDDPARLPGALTRALGLTCSPEAEPLEEAAAALGGAPALVVLDNYEQLLARPGPADPRVLVRDLLNLAPALRCLITSRQALAVEGEVELRLAPLSTPSRAGTDCESVALFVDRARSIDGSFSLTAGNTAEVAALCERLEGLPLAIEMAAAWVRVLPSGGMLERLERGLTDLAARRQDVPGRHRSLRAALDWSFELLDPELRRVFAALSVFRGGWSLAAAEAVVGDGALDLLADLAERSLVVVDAQGTRYRYLEAVREYAAERLGEMGEADARARHARHYLAMAGEGVALAQAHRHHAWNELVREHANLYAALEWLAESGQIEELCGTAFLLAPYWLHEGHHMQDGVHWAERALSLHTARDTSRWRALCCAAQLAAPHDRPDTARQRYQEALDIAREQGDPLGALWATAGLVRLAADTGDVEEARRRSAECEAILPSVEDAHARAEVLIKLAGSMSRIGDAVAQERIFRECASVARTVGLGSELAQSLYGLAISARDRGDIDTARALWEECVAVDEAHGVRGGGALWGLGLLAEARGDAAGAACWYSRSLRENLALRNPSGVAEGLHFLAVQALRAGDPERSARLVGAELCQWNLLDARLRRSHQEPVQAVTSELRDLMGVERCDTLLQEGWHMGPEAAIELGLAYLQEPPAAAQR